MNSIPPLAWISIACIGLITVLINIGMVMLLRDPSQLRKLKMPRGGPSGVDMKKAIDVLRDPFCDEREQLNELSTLVHRLEESPAEHAPARDNPAEEAKKTG